MIPLLCVACLFCQIKEITPNKTWDIEIITKKSIEYTLLTKNDPVTLTVEGPTYLRVYTRIVWPKGKKGNQIYKIILQENNVDERIITLESTVSEVSRDQRGRAVSKWRSFHIEVPEGLNHFKIMHWASPEDTILMNFAYESPRTWQDIPATTYAAILEAIEEEKIVTYYELTKGNKIGLTVNGPMKIKVVTRLNFDTNLMGDQPYTLIVDDNGVEETHHMKCYRSETITYRNRKDVVPANARSFYYDVNNGSHVLHFTLTGTLAQSTGLRFLTEE